MFLWHRPLMPIANLPNKLSVYSAPSTQVGINHHLVPSLGVIPLNPLEPVEKDVWESSTLLDKKINPIRYCEILNVSRNIQILG